MKTMDEPLGSSYAHKPILMLIEWFSIFFLQGADSTASEPLSGLKKLGSSLLDAFKTELEREIFRSGIRDMNPHPATRDFLATLFGNRSSSE